MQVYQWDGGCNDITAILAVTIMEATSLGDLDLKERLDAINNRVEVIVDQWTYPARDRKYSETPGGTWIMEGRYGRDMRFVLAANPKDSRLAREELKAYVVALGEYDDDPGEGEIPEDIEIGEPEEQEGEMPPNFVAVNVEGEDNHVCWYAYFRSTPTDQDLGAAYEAIRLDEARPALEPEAPEESQNSLSRELGLVRFYMGQAV
jgi:hypothetical protein